jgi:hypothetical protein
VRAGVVGAAGFALCLLLSAAAPSFAQAPSAPPPLPGFVPPYEITKIVRKAGFIPLAPPMREGTNYVLRATDHRGILMRVVVDARSGAIRAVNRIVPPGSMGLATSPNGPSPYGPSPYGPGPIGLGPYPMPPPYGTLPAYGPSDLDGSEIAAEEGLEPPPAPAVHPPGHPAVFAPPLPRPRPPELASRELKSGTNLEDKPAATPAAKPDAAPSAAVTAPPAPPVPPASPAPPPSVAAKKPPPERLPD